MEKPTTLRVEDLPTLPMEQLRMVKAQVEQEVEALRESLTALRRALQRLQSSKEAVKGIAKAPPGAEILVPLTGSLFVPGVVDSHDKLLVDIGATYFVEKSIPETEDYCDRRVNLVKDNLQKAVTVLGQKEQVSEAILEAIQAKMQAVLGAK